MARPNLEFALLACVACGGASSDRIDGGSVDESGDSGGANLADASMRDSAQAAAPPADAGSTDAAGDESAFQTPPPNDQRQIVGEGQCRPQGAFLTVTLDGASLDGMDWKAEDFRTPNVVESASAFDAEGGASGFRVDFPFKGLKVGTWDARAVGASVQYGGPPSFTCVGDAVSGAVWISAILMEAGAYEAEVCGSYDLDCNDGSGHTLHIECTFDNLVAIQSGNGGL